MARPKAKKKRKSRAKQIWVSMLNVVAHPHEDGPDTYAQLIERAAADKVTTKYYGERFLSIGACSREDGAIVGQLFTFLAVASDSPILNRDTGRVLSPEQMKAIPFDWEKHGLVFKKIDFAFDLRTHRLGFDASHNSAVTVAIALRAIFAKVAPQIGIDRVAVEVEQSEDALARILSLKLRRLTIRLTRPNPDDNADFLAEFEDELERQNAVAETIILESDTELRPDARTVMKAQYALSNGHVEGRGKEKETGRMRERTTEMSPVREPHVHDPDRETRRTFIRRVATAMAVGILERPKRGKKR